MKTRRCIYDGDNFCYHEKERKNNKMSEKQSSGNVGVGPTLVTEFAGIELQEQFVKLTNRVLTKIKVAIPIYKNINATFHRYGPYTLCKATYLDPDKKFRDYTGFGMATKSHRDSEYPQAGMNIAFMRSIKDLFVKYSKINNL